MRRNGCTTPSLVALALAGMFGLAGCDLDVPDLNNPPLEELEENPTANGVASACVGLLIGTRAGTSNPNGYISQLGILARESYNFDAADPRYVSELLEGPLNPASPFGGNFWLGPYTNLRLGDIIQRAKEDVVDFDDTQRSAISGFVKTIRALDLLRVLSTRDEIGGVIDTDHDVTELGAVVSKDELMTYIVDILDEAEDELAAGGDAFPFELSGGFDGFSTPTSFIQFNRALRVRMAVYQEDFETVLALLPETFFVALDVNSGLEDLDIGVYHTFGTGVGDVQNGLINPNIYAHASIAADAEEGDDRVARKIVADQPEGSARGLSSTTKFLLYNDPEDFVPIIRNEELMLFRAEALLRTGDLAAAQADLDIIRDVSGFLPPLAAGLDAEQLEDALLYERRYSLLFEGHRLLDLRRYGRIEDLPLDEPTGDDPPVHQRNVRWPLPQQECDARPDEARCAMGSQL